MNNHILITGRPGVGKTTLMKTIISKIQLNYSIAGFYTEEVRIRGKRVGFDIQTIDGKKGVLARLTIPPWEHHYTLGKYMVSIADIEDIGVPELLKKADIIVCDEIGNMELFSAKFKEAILYILDNASLLIATISVHNNQFINSVKLRKNTTILELTVDNRNELCGMIINKIERSMSQK